MTWVIPEPAPLSYTVPVTYRFSHRVAPTFHLPPSHSHPIFFAGCGSDWELFYKDELIELSLQSYECKVGTVVDPTLDV